jgi:branched-chain amino acid transport system permease protein
MIETIFTGLLTGCIYALMALAFSIIYTTTNVVNFALGELLMIAAMMIFTLSSIFGIPLFASIIIGFIFVVIISLIIKTVALSRLQKLDTISAFLVTLAFGILLYTCAQLIWGTAGAKFPDVFGKVPLFELANLTVTSHDVATLIIVAVILVIMDLLYRKTLIGKSMQAVSEDQDACGVIGLHVTTISALAFSIAAVLCTVAALLLAPIAGANVQLGTMVGLKGFAAGILGGLTNGRSAIAGGIIFGLAESISGYLLGGESKEIVIFVAIMLILAIRPTGLWGESTLRRQA